MTCHKGQSVIIDKIVFTPSLQDRQERTAGLRGPRPKDSETLVANMGCVEATLAAMTRRCVIDRDPRPCLKPRSQDVLIFTLEVFKASADQSHDLALRYLHAHAAQERGQPFCRDLALEVAGYDEAPKIRAKPAANACRHRSRNMLARWRNPTLAAISYNINTNDKVLDQDVLVPFKPRTGGHASLQQYIATDSQLVALGATARLARSLTHKLRRCLIHT